MDFDHHYAVTVDWHGDRGSGTSGYRDYGRQNVVTAPGKASIDGSADPAFRGDAERWNPEEMLLAALAQCHMLSYLHVAVMHGVVVTGYTDAAVGTMRQTHDGGGHFTSVTLRPRVEVSEASMVELAESLHHEASAKCFIAASVNFPIAHEPETAARA
jgi:organic hydroperoxide reductase OsmC/OhrA